MNGQESLITYFSCFFFFSLLWGHTGLAGRWAGLSSGGWRRGHCTCSCSCRWCPCSCQQHYFCWCVLLPFKASYPFPLLPFPYFPFLTPSSSFIPPQSQLFIHPSILQTLFSFLFPTYKWNIDSLQARTIKLQDSLFVGLLGDIFGMASGGATAYTVPKQVWLPANRGKGMEIHGTFARR